MLILLIISTIIGLIVGSLSGIWLVGLIAGRFIFICGLPAAMTASFVHGEISYAQDRADYKQMLADINANIRAEEHESAEDERTDRIVKKPEEVADAGLQRQTASPYSREGIKVCFLRKSRTGYGVATS